MITVHWTDYNGREHSADREDPTRAAQLMLSVILSDNLQPAGWTWDTEEERSRVLDIRNGRDYPSVALARWRKHEERARQSGEYVPGGPVARTSLHNGHLAPPA